MLPGKAITTAMGILPHTDLEKALDLSLSLDIPFWPQLPRFRFKEDMYAQFAEYFPGIIIDEDKELLRFSNELFAAQLDEYLATSADPEAFALSPEFSVALRAFLDLDLSQYTMIRGQTVGPVSFGLKICDEDLKPMIYNDFVREIMYDFLKQKMTWQYHELEKVHPNPFVWLDEPGLEMIFNSFSAYTSELAQTEYRAFLAQLPGPKGVHLCGNPDWSFLLNADLDILSVDAFSWGHILVRYQDEVKEFLHKGGIIAWGITPTLTSELETETAATLTDRLLKLWEFLGTHGLDEQLIFDRSWLAPSRCCLINTDGTASVEQSFRLLKQISANIRSSKEF
ncbi:uroporphyrinogen decarboxylase/cobalamine-independent methonine synthase family protein [Paradesulfitobacterium ferrireducens]|uniref:hypothetical protein n=1 Tax=Paradesulfitobacterium ferrireducens TaxID=2816476 RepID=UPI001A9029D3|nr:hypothetical protein [Paradesulfitobacterium ferrireducens]